MSGAGGTSPQDPGCNRDENLVGSRGLVHLGGEHPHARAHFDSAGRAGSGEVVPPRIGFSNGEFDLQESRTGAGSVVWMYDVGVGVLRGQKSRGA